MRKGNKRRNVYLAAVLGLGIVILSGCGGAGGETGRVNDTSKAETAGTANTMKGKETTEKVEITVLQYKTELSEQMNAMAEDYMKENPNVDHHIESVISNDYDTVLKTRFASGEAPDIFNNQGYNNMTQWLDNLEDLSHHTWIPDMLDLTKEAVDFYITKIILNRLE